MDCIKPTPVILSAFEDDATEVKASIMSNYIGGGSYVTSGHTSNDEDSIKDENECNCNICLYPLVCSTTYDPFVDKNLCIQSECKLGCTCSFHFNCIVDFIRSKFVDSSSVSAEGMECPNGKQCAHFKATNSCYYLAESELLELVAFGTLVRNNLSRFKHHPIDFQALMRDGSDKISDDDRILFNSVSCANELGVSILSYSDLKEFISKSTLARAEARKLISWIEDKTAKYFANKVDPYVKATSKGCPECGTRVTHYHGHQCHHVSPDGGCPNCQTNFCYKCLGSENANLELRGNRRHCQCGHWSNYCSRLDNMGDIVNYIKFNSNIPYDSRCGCSICPDCRFEKPCSYCPGDCSVCLGYTRPGPSTILKVYKEASHRSILGVRFTSADYLVDQSSLQMNRFTLWEACRHGTLLELPPEADDFINSQDMEGRSALIMACDAGHTGTVRILLRHHDIDINLVDMDGQSALHWAASNGHVDCMELLLRNLADPNIETKTKKDTPLICTIKNRQIECLDCLIAYPNVFVNTLNSDGYSPLHVAVRMNQPVALLSLLRRHNINVMQKDKNGYTAMTCAMKLQLEDCTCLLMDKCQVNINEEVGSGLPTLLLWSCRLGFKYCAKKALLHPDIDINRVDREGKSPLYWACENGHLEISSEIQGHPSYQLKKRKKMKFGSRKYAP